MSRLYADTSALTRAYLADEFDHEPVRALLLEGDDDVVTSELARVEFASAMRGAGAAGRAPTWRDVLERFDADCTDAGPLALIALQGAIVFKRAYEIVIDQHLYTLDAVHLAVALEESVDEFVTRDARQAEAAAALGLAVR